MDISNDNSWEYWKNIRQIIEKHYKKQNSNYIYGGRKSYSRKKTEIYYNIAGFQTANQLMTLIENGMFFIEDDIKSVTFHFSSEKKSNNFQRPFMVKLCEEDEYYVLIFYAITGYEVIKSYRKTALKLITVDKPLSQIMLSRRTGGLFQKSYEGQIRSFHFSWWINKMLKENIIFRSFLTDLLEYKGKKYYIYLDIARGIKNNHFCIIPNTMEQVEKYYTPNSLIKGITHSELDIDFNKKGINYSYYTAKISDQIQKCDWGRLLAIDETIMSNWICSGDLYDENPRVEHFLKKYYESVWDISSFEFDFLLSDYVNNCRDTGAKLSLRISSIEKLRKINERENMKVALLSDDEEENLVKNESKFSMLAEKLPDDFEWIITKTRLYDETIRQKNCVFSYRGRIRQDVLAIIHWEKKDPILGYTIEIRCNKNGKFEIAQMKGENNSEPYLDDYYKAKELIEAIPVQEESLDNKINSCEIIESYYREKMVPLLANKQ